MGLADRYKNILFDINVYNFNEKALELFRYQAENNEIYKYYLSLIRVDPGTVNSIEKIPFLPIEFFKSQIIKTGTWKEEVLFKSSGTTGQVRSCHYIKDHGFYHKVSKVIFESFFGPLEDFTFLALLPSYRENPHSSLISMLDYFIGITDKNGSQYINSIEDVQYTISKGRELNKRIILWGVSYALLDLAEFYPQDLSQVIIIETGGMKGRGKELTKEELNDILQRRFKNGGIMSEYGMTELLSQGYSLNNGIYTLPGWMKVVTRELNDPFTISAPGRPGGINVIDLANIDSCAFIETKDLGVVSEDGSFQILGRIDNSDIRGCNLLYTG